MQTSNIGKVLTKLGLATRSQSLTFLRQHKVFDISTSAKRVLGASHKINFTNLPSNKPILTIDDREYTVTELRDPFTILFNKGKGLICSTTYDQEDSRIVYDVLPENFFRMHPTLACVGRLDKDTTGLLVLTQDGKLQDLINSAHVSKTYLVTLEQDLTEEMFESDIRKPFASGIQLHGEIRPCKPATAEWIHANQLLVTLKEGMYHQVKRMFASRGYTVAELERSAIGPLNLKSETLKENDWRILTPPEIESLLKKQ